METVTILSQEKEDISSKESFFDYIRTKDFVSKSEFADYCQYIAFRFLSRICSICLKRYYMVKDIYIQIAALKVDIFFLKKLNILNDSTINLFLPDKLLKFCKLKPNKGTIFLKQMFKFQNFKKKPILLKMCFLNAALSDNDSDFSLLKYKEKWSELTEENQLLLISQASKFLVYEPAIYNFLKNISGFLNSPENTKEDLEKIINRFINSVDSL